MIRTGTEARLKLKEVLGSRQTDDADGIGNPAVHRHGIGI